MCYSENCDLKRLSFDFLTNERDLGLFAACAIIIIDAILFASLFKPAILFCFDRDCVTMYVTCYLKNQMYSQYPLQSLYAGTFMDRCEKALLMHLCC